jgi:cytochrome P450
MTTNAPVLAGPIPSATRLPLRALLRAMRDNPIAVFSEEAFDRLILDQKVLTLRIFLVNDPAGIKHVLLDNATNYHKAEMGRRVLEPGLGRGLLTSEGAVWRTQRRIMAPAFDAASLRFYAPVIGETAADLMDSWARLKPGETIDIYSVMMRLTLQIISRTMFSSDSDEIAGIIERSFANSQAGSMPNMFDFMGLPAWLAGWRRNAFRRRLFAPFDAVIHRLIAERASGADGRRDLLARLVAARDDESGQGMSSEEVRSQAITIFLAGHETTALALTWTWYLLALHPIQEARLHAELDAVLGGRTPTYDDLPDLAYTRMVIEESMRLYPPAPFMSREPIEDDVICGHDVPKGAHVAINPWIVHRHRRLWDDPLRFDPERFSPERSADRPRFAYLPFGGGPRVCIGGSFAMMEAVLALAALAQKYRLRLMPGHRVEPRGLITLQPKYGMAMRVKPR